MADKSQLPIKRISNISTGLASHKINNNTNPDGEVIHETHRTDDPDTGEISSGVPSVDLDRTLTQADFCRTPSPRLQLVKRRGKRTKAESLSRQGLSPLHAFLCSPNRKRAAELTHCDQEGRKKLTIRWGLTCFRLVRI